MIPPTLIVTPALAGSDQNSAVGAGRRLANLDVNLIMVQNDLTADSDYVELQAAAQLSLFLSGEDDASSPSGGEDAISNGVRPSGAATTNSCSANFVIASAPSSTAARSSSRSGISCSIQVKSRQECWTAP